MATAWHRSAIHAMYPMGSNFYKANLGEVGFRLVAAAENWQACDSFRRYQTLTCYLAGCPLYPLKPEAGWIAVRQTT